MHPAWQKHGSRYWQGAFEVINYKREDISLLFKDTSERFDVVVDLVGGQHSKCWPPSYSLDTLEETSLHFTSLTGNQDATRDHCVSPTVHKYIQTRKLT